MSGILIHSFHDKGREQLEAWLASREQLSSPPRRYRNFLVRVLRQRRRLLNPKQVRDNPGQETKVRFTRLPSAVTRNIQLSANVPFPGGGIQWKRSGKTSSLPFE